jgi:hypothetical protein
MSQKSIKRDAFKEFKRRKQHVREHLRSPHPFATVLLDDQKNILAIGMNRATLAEHAAKQGWDKYEMVDYAVVI